MSAFLARLGRVMSDKSHTLSLSSSSLPFPVPSSLKCALYAPDVIRQLSLSCKAVCQVAVVYVLSPVKLPGLASLAYTEPLVSTACAHSNTQLKENPPHPAWNVSNVRTVPLVFGPLCLRMSVAILSKAADGAGARVIHTAATPTGYVEQQELVLLSPSVSAAAGKRRTARCSSATMKASKLILRPFFT